METSVDSLLKTLYLLSKRVEAKENAAPQRANGPFNKKK